MMAPPANSEVEMRAPPARRMTLVGSLLFVLAWPLFGGCLKLTPSPLQDLGPLLASLFGATPTQTRTYVIVGNQGTILRSQDGLTWTTHSVPTTNNINAVVWNGTRFVAVGPGSGSGQSARAYHSTDGTTWTEVITGCSGGTSAGNLLSVAASSSRTVAVGQDGAPQPCITYSSDGGLTWLTATVPGGAGTYRGAAYVANAFVSQGPSTYTHRGATGTSFTANGTTPLNAAGTYSNLFLHTASNRLLVFGDGGGKNQASCHSTDGGVSFGACQAIFGGNGAGESPNAMAASTTRIVAVGAAFGAQCRLDFTENFSTYAWQSPAIFISAACPGVALNGIAHDGSKFIAVGAGGRIGISPSGSPNDWVFSTLGTQNLNAITVAVQ